MKPKVIDLFCGAGGLSLGFEMAGFEVVLGVDFNENAIACHEHNFPDSNSVHIDITTVTPESLLERYGIDPKEIDVVIGGFPCQGFSLAGKRLIDDPRNLLYKECVKYVEYIKPKAFMFENVKGILSTNKGKALEEILDSFRALGYDVQAKLLMATDYGVAQIRERVIIVGSRIGEISYPTPSHEKPVTVGEILKGLPPLKSGEGGEILQTEQGEFIHNHKAVTLKELNQRRIEALPEGGKYGDIPESLRRKIPYTSSYVRLHRDRPSNTIPTHFRDSYFTHPTEDRILTVREAARIQSFPDDFVFVGPRARNGQYGAVGNAVPPLMAKAVASEILKTLESHEDKESLPVGMVKK